MIICKVEISLSRLGFGILYQLNVRDHAYQKNVEDHNRGEDSIVQNSSKRRVSMDPFRALVGRVIDCLFPMMIYETVRYQSVSSRDEIGSVWSSF